MSPPWSALLTWEGHCKPHLIIFHISTFFSRWGTHYDYGNKEVCHTLLDFAEEKLLCLSMMSSLDNLSLAQMYAVLSQCLALDPNIPQYLSFSAFPINSLEAMHKQIAKHMRICVAVEEGTGSLHGITSSEPILSEAASRIMSVKGFSLPGALSQVLTRYCTDLGEHGELIVTSLFT